MGEKDYFTEYVPINGIQQFFLHYRVDSRTVVLFLHGGPGQTELFFTYLTRPQTPCCSFVFYDQRGTGKTQARNKTRPHDISLDILIDDLKGTVKYVKQKYSGQNIVLLGHSWGSVLGVEYVKRYPNSVSAYVGMGQVVDMHEGERIGFEKLKTSVMSKGAVKDVRLVQGLNGYPYGLTKENHIKTVMKLRRLQMKYGYTIGMIAMLKKIMRSPLFSVRDIWAFLTTFRTNKNLMNMLISYSTKQYIQFSLPVFFICGKNDWQVPSVLAEQYLDAICAPYKQLFWIENAGHLADIDNPDQYNKAVAAICSSLERS